MGLLQVPFGSFAVAKENNQPPDGFETLFNGTDLAGWTGGTTRHPAEIASLPAEEALKWREQLDARIAMYWKVEDRQLVSDGQEPHLITDRDYVDVEFWVDWTLSSNEDSGIYLRGWPQVQIWDPANEAEKVDGADRG